MSFEFRISSLRTVASLTIVGVLASFVLLACEGPTGPEGPEGPRGAQGPRGPRGPGAQIINLDLSDHVGRAVFDRGSNTTSSEGDTLSIEWGVTLDTTITSVTVEDTMYVQVYVRVPDVGFQQAPSSSTSTAQATSPT